jgi:FAD:protein FMN transferase
MHEWKNLPTRVILGLFCLLGGCGTASSAPALQRFEYVELHMACLVRLVFYAANQDSADRAAVAAYRRVAQLEDVMSDYDPKSELSRLCQQPPGTPVPISRDLFDVLKESQRIAAGSDGAFDVTLGPVIRLWRNARKSHAVPEPAVIQEAKARSGWRNLRLSAHPRSALLLRTNMQLDLGGIGKGYAADQALRVLREHGIRRAMVAASGDIALGAPPPGKPGWRIGIDPLGHPTNGVERLALLSHCGISTSGDLEQFVDIAGVRYSHIVDPNTGLGLTNRIAVTVIAPRATWSDAYATTVSVLGAQRGLRLIESKKGFSAQIVAQDATGLHVYRSRRFPPPAAEAR